MDPWEKLYYALYNETFKDWPSIVSPNYYWPPSLPKRVRTKPLPLSPPKSLGPSEVCSYCGGSGWDDSEDGNVLCPKCHGGGAVEISSDQQKNT